MSSGMTIATDFGYSSFPTADGTKWHTVMTNKDIESASVSQDQFGKYAVSFSLTSEGTKLFSDYTAKHIDHYLGVILDKVVLSAPMIASPITDGRAVITGDFSQQEAQNLVAYLLHGPLPAPLKVNDIVANGE
jgi:preprotein translocase subunit SecD